MLQEHNKVIYEQTSEFSSEWSCIEMNKPLQNIKLLFL